MTDEEKYKMYMKLKKKHLVAMHIRLEKVLDTMLPGPEIIPPAVSYPQCRTFVPDPMGGTSPKCILCGRDAIAHTPPYTGHTG